MSVKYTRNNLQKIELVFKEQEYVIRYEKGSFHSGYCIVKEKKVVVINKFFDIKARINVLLDILSMIVIDPSKLSPSSLDILNEAGLRLFAEQAA